MKRIYATPRRHTGKRLANLPRTEPSDNKTGEGVELAPPSCQLPSRGNCGTMTSHPMVPPPPLPLPARRLDTKPHRRHYELPPIRGDAESF